MVIVYRTPPSDAVLDFNPASWLIYLSRCHMKFPLYGPSVLKHSAHLRMHPIRPSMLVGTELLPISLKHSARPVFESQKVTLT